MSINSKNGENPKISVLMPVYKTPESYLKEAIESILNQTFTDFEFLILDDCPEQSVERIVKFYRDERIKYYKNEKNLGISASRNRLMDLAKGEYLAVMDHDDIALPERLAKEIAFLEAHSDVGVVGTWYERFPNKKVKKKYVINSQIERDLMSNCSILHPSAMIRKSVLLENNIRYEAEFSPAEDYMLWVRLIGKTKFANIPEVLLKYRDYAGNTSKIQAEKMKSARNKVHKILEENQPQMLQENWSRQKISFCGIPLITRRQRGCCFKYKCFGLVERSVQEPIMTFDAGNLPIYIINFNRLSYLQQMIAVLEKYGLRNIHIIDNVSTYPPMVEYLKQTPYKVHYMKKNYGHMVFFWDDEFKNVRENEYYVLTDPDVIAAENCPADFMDRFYQILQQYPKVNKVGFSLKTDDIHGSKKAKELLVKWEGLYYKHRLNRFEPYLYDSSIDTTFAMYRPHKDWKTDDFYKAIRIGAPYEARHLPWYKDLSDLSDEDKFYNQADCGSGNWNSFAGLERIRECLISKTVEHWWEYVFSVKSSYRRIIVRVLGVKLTFDKEMRGD